MSTGSSSFCCGPAFFSRIFFFYFFIFLLLLLLLFIWRLSLAPLRFHGSGSIRERVPRNVHGTQSVFFCFCWPAFTFHFHESGASPYIIFPFLPAGAHETTRASRRVCGVCMFDGHDVSVSFSHVSETIACPTSLVIGPEGAAVNQTKTAEPKFFYATIDSKSSIAPFGRNKTNGKKVRSISESMRRHHVTDNAPCSTFMSVSALSLAPAEKNGADVKMARC